MLGFIGELIRQMTLITFGARPRQNCASNGLADQLVAGLL
jgi:hypothetical protein